MDTIEEGDGNGSGGTCHAPLFDGPAGASRGGGGRGRGPAARDRPPLPSQRLVRLPAAAAATSEGHVGPQATRRRPDPCPEPGRPAASGGSDPGSERRHPGPASAAGRLRLQPDDYLARLAPVRLDFQEEDPARRRARPVRRPGEAASFRRKVKRVEPKRLVFVDETGVTTAMTRAYGWAPRGERAVGSAPSSWESLTVIAALGLDGVRAPLVFPGSTDTAAFESYVEQVLVPELHAGDVVVWTTCPPIRLMPPRRPSGGRVPGSCPCRPTARTTRRSRDSGRRSRRTSARSRRGTRMPSTMPWERRSRR